MTPSPPSPPLSHGASSEPPPPQEHLIILALPKLTPQQRAEYRAWPLPRHHSRPDGMLSPKSKPSSSHKNPTVMSQMKARPPRPPRPQAIQDVLADPSLNDLLDDGSDIQDLAEMPLAKRRQKTAIKRSRQNAVASSGDEHDEITVLEPKLKRWTSAARQSFSENPRGSAARRASYHVASSSRPRKSDGDLKVDYHELLASGDERDASPNPLATNFFRTPSHSEVRQITVSSSREALNRLKKKRARHALPTLTRSSEDLGDRPGRLIIVSDNEHSSPPPATYKRHRLSEKGKHATQACLDPDDEPAHEAETDEEQDMVESIKLDNPEDFQVESRLRSSKKETQGQRAIRHLKNRRLGITEVSSSSEGDEEPDSAEEYYGDDLLPDGTVRDPFITEENEMYDFIEDDGQDPAGYELPAQFAGARGQSEETKFRIVFQYFLYLAMHGPERARDLPEKEKTYFEPFLDSMRTRMTDYRNSRVRSQAWRQELVRKLSKYPYFCVQFVDPEPGCDACNMSGRISRFALSLEGRPYDPVTFESVTDSHDDSDSSSIAEEDDQEWDGHDKPWETSKGKGNTEEKTAKREYQLAHLRVDYEWLEYEGGMDIGEEAEEKEEVEQRNVDSYLIGRYCKRRAQVFHMFSHWEFILYHRIKQLYTDLLTRMGYKVPDVRSAREAQNYAVDDEDHFPGRTDTRQILMKDRAAVLRGINFPEDCEDLESVLQWMIGERYVQEQQEWIETLIEKAENLEKMPSDR
ncbi:hypothetical protein IAR50_005890 [Cryptococcus sp. DSM 104548]